MARRIDYAKLTTEKPNPASRALDQLTTRQILSLMTQEDQRIPRAVRSAHAAMGRAVDWMAQSLRAGGRLFFVGAGTSGRLGVMEAAECPPTFNTPPGKVQAIMAGGRAAVFRSQEGAEDRSADARRQIRRRVRRGDVVVGIAASGVTPFVRAALAEAKRQDAQTVLVTCNHRSPQKSADIVIAPPIGPEVVAGSTRLKAGTAAKMILNMLTTASMVRLGKVYGPWMVDLQPTSRKLHARAVHIVSRLAQISEREAKATLRHSRGHVKTAILMGRRPLSYFQAVTLLRRCDGNLRKALICNHQICRMRA